MRKAASRSNTRSRDAKLFRAAVSRLRRRFGPQGWWPRLVRRTDGLVVVKHHPGNPSRWIAQTASDRAFEVAIGAILTQNTAWKNVETALICLSRAKLMTSKRIATARSSKIQSCVRSSGYYRQKAKKLKLFARFVEEELRGDLNALSSSSSGAKDLPIGRSLRASRDDIVKIARKELLSLWGIGPETTDTILLYGLGVPTFVVDAYTRRFLADITGSRRWLTMPYDDVRTFCEAALRNSVSGTSYLVSGKKYEVRSTIRVWREAHALIVAWGKRGIPANETHGKP